MKQETIDKLIKHLTTIKEQGISIREYQIVNNLSETFIYNKIASVKKDKENINSVDYDNIMRLYESTKKIVGNSDLEQTDEYSSINLERDENGRICKYSFRIPIKDKAPLIGNFTRDEMSLIYRLYSSYGSNITQREVSRFFPEYSLFDFKRILRAFNITKASSPFPQHIIEENSKETLLDMQFREKENDFLKSYEAEKVRQLDSQLKKYMKENADLKEQLNTFGGLLDNLDLSKINKINSPICASNKTEDLFIWISDMHIGASVSSTALYTNSYNKFEVRNRLDKIVNSLVRKNGYDRIIVCNLGDSLDGYDGYTGSHTHKLPQNMNNKEQVKCFIEEMTNFMGDLACIPNNGIWYYAVGDSNHGCDFEYAAQTALCAILNHCGINAKLFDTPIGIFDNRDQNFVLFHGKDGTNMFKNWPLTLNDKTENFINQVLDENNIYKATVVKGDLHQSATTYGKRIKYKSVGSLFGSSEWCSMNFGKTEACCDYSIIDDKGNSLDGRIIF